MEINKLKEKYKLFFECLDNKNTSYYYDSLKGMLIINNHAVLANDDYNNNNNNYDNYNDLLFPPNVVFNGNIFLHCGYKYIFNKYTYIEGGLYAFVHNKSIILKSLGETLIVNKNVDLSNVIINKFPDIFEIGGELTLNKAITPKILDNVIIAGKRFEYHNTNLKLLGQKFFFNGEVISIDNYKNNGIEILDENIFKNNKNNTIKIVCNENKENQLLLSGKFINKKLVIDCGKTFIKNSYVFKNNTNIKFSIRERLGLDKHIITFYSFEEYYKYKILSSKFEKLNQNMLNVLNYYVPNSLYSKLLTSEIDQITSKEIKYFYDNKKKLEEYTKYDQNNIILYCRSKNAFNFLIEHNYQFNKTELLQINEKYISTLYENAYLNNINLYKTNKEKNNKKNIIDKIKLKNIL